MAQYTVSGARYSGLTAIIVGISWRCVCIDLPDTDYPNLYADHLEGLWLA